ncbi:MAG: carboxypeptidase-like regulatory domain-containing protein [Bacteroidales bacterium]|nr:carboxypeptidase-like regulatory domain-containing protein [Bacteroidales bacterium]
MRIPLIVFFLYVSQFILAQQLIVAKVKDSQTKEPLVYCNISVIGKNKGTITNTNGEFSIDANPITDKLSITYLGYDTKTVSTSELVAHPVILLTPKEMILNEVTVHAGNEYLYDFLVKCAKTLENDNSRLSSKAYYGSETWISDSDAELIECYFNAKYRGHHIIDLFLKNGRISMSVIDNRIYNNMSNSNIIKKLNLVEYDSFFPESPLQFNKRKLLKYYDLKLIGSDSLMYIISFTPMKDTTKYFSGEIWINRKKSTILKIHLLCKNSTTIPFEGYAEDSLSNVNIEFTETFKELDGKSVPELIIFNYELLYHTATGAQLRFIELPEMNRVITSKNILYLYDYDIPFLMPYFEYDSEISDYTKISLIPYNDFFWHHNNAITLTSEQKAKLGIFTDKNYSVNITEGCYGKDFMSDGKLKWFDGKPLKWSGQYTFWYPERRVFINKAMPSNKTATQTQISELRIEDLFNIEVQILLDVNTFEDSINCRSYTVFDEVKSYYRLPVKEYTNPFVNILFDICEIERQKMQNQLDLGVLNLSQIDSLYNKTMEDMGKLTYKFSYDSDFGKRVIEMTKWNKYVVDNLGIDNIKMFEEYYEERELRNDSILKAGGVPPKNIFE